MRLLCPEPEMAEGCNIGVKEALKLRDGRCLCLSCASGAGWNALIRGQTFFGIEFSL